VVPISISEESVLAALGAWMWPFMRVGGFVMAAPIIGTRTVPLRIRVILVLALTAVLAPVVAVPADLAPFSADGVVAVAQQIMIGATLGLILRLAFLVFEFAGQLIAQQMGLGFAAMVDPSSGAQVPVFAHLYMILASLLFVASNAHLALIKLLGESFVLLPVSRHGLSPAAAELIVAWAGSLFGTALLLGLPLVVALLAVNLALGVMARAAPQLNIFSVGFPVTILAGVMLAALTLDDLSSQGLAVFDSAFDTVRAALTAR